MLKRGRRSSRQPTSLPSLSTSSSSSCAWFHSRTSRFTRVTSPSSAARNTRPKCLPGALVSGWLIVRYPGGDFALGAVLIWPGEVAVSGAVGVRMTHWRGHSFGGSASPRTCATGAGWKRIGSSRGGSRPSPPVNSSGWALRNLVHSSCTTQLRMWCFMRRTMCVCPRFFAICRAGHPWSSGCSGLRYPGHGLPGSVGTTGGFWGGVKAAAGNWRILLSSGPREALTSVAAPVPLARPRFEQGICARPKKRVARVRVPPQRRDVDGRPHIKLAPLIAPVGVNEAR